MDEEEIIEDYVEVYGELPSFERMWKRKMPTYSENRKVWKEVNEKAKKYFLNLGNKLLADSRFN